MFMEFTGCDLNMAYVSDLVQLTAWLLLLSSLWGLALSRMYLESLADSWSDYRTDGAKLIISSNYIFRILKQKQ